MMAGITRAGFAQRLKDAMDAHGFDPKDMAAIGWPEETISRWKRQRSGPPGLADRRKLARGLYLPPDAFDLNAREWGAALKDLKARLAGGELGSLRDDTRLALLALLGATAQQVKQARELLLGRRSDDLEATDPRADARPAQAREPRRRGGD